MIRMLKRSAKPTLAYAQHVGTTSPGIVFLSGFMSKMTGEKALAIENWCRLNDHSFVRFDYHGTGSSGGKVTSLSNWIEDATDVISALTHGNQVIVGSSMGAFIGLHLMKRFPQRISGMIGVAPSFFFANSMNRSRNSGKFQICNNKAILPSPYGALEIPTMFLDSLPDADLFQDKQTFHLTCPLHIIHGMLDVVVPWQTSLQFIESTISNTSHDVSLTLRKAGEHRLSTNEDIEVILSILQCMIKQIKNSLNVHSLV